jgi:hypothetical protein
MESQLVITKASQAIQIVEEKLKALSGLEAQSKELFEAIEQLRHDESDLLASDADESSKVKSLLRIKATHQSKASNLAKAKSKIQTLTAELHEAGIKADRWLGAIRDGLSEARRARVLADAGAFFPKDAHLEVKRLLRFALLVKEVEEMDRPTWTTVRPELSVENCKKLRSSFDKMVEFINAEPVEPTFTVGDGW